MCKYKVLAALLLYGLTLNYGANQIWNFAIWGRFEKLRFRLDKDGNRIIKESSDPGAFFGLTFNVRL